MRWRFAATLGAAALLTVSCNSLVDPSNNVTDTFQGTIPIQGTGPGHFFSSNKNGEFSIKVTALSPNAGVFFGTILAQGPTNGVCAGNLPIIQQNSFGTINTPVLAGSFYAGSYCVFLFDIGAFTVAQNYTLVVSHP
jgi:hypothetical protein